MRGQILSGHPHCRTVSGQNLPGHDQDRTFQDKICQDMIRAGQRQAKICNPNSHGYVLVPIPDDYEDIMETIEEEEKEDVDIDEHMILLGQEGGPKEYPYMQGRKDLQD